MLSQLCLHRIFEEQAARTPDAPAVSDGRETLTYAQLDDRAARLASAILDHAPAPGSRIGLYLRRGNDVVAAVIAVLKAGCSYVPLDPSYPGDRVRYMAEDASLDLVVADQDTADALPDATVITVGDAVRAHPPLDPGKVQATPDLPAYVIYTSGSSGNPKGVEVSHRNVTALLAACDKVFDLRDDDVWTLFHSPCFDFSVWEMWGALAHGARLVVVPAETARSPEAFLDLVVSERVTVLNQVPSVFRYLSRSAVAREPAAGGGELPLRYVIFGGEPVDLEAVRGWREVHGRRAEFFNMYGITETTVFATYRRLPEAETDAPSGAAREGLAPADPAAPPRASADPELNIGRPLDGLDVELLDEWGGRTPPGRIGELCLAGDQLAIGYLNRPELTDERYPLLDVAGTGTARRYYRSGDLALALPDGSWEFAGRADDQVKINGYRIETSEIEAALRTTDGVQDLVVVPVTSRIGERMLTAFYAPASDASAAGDDLAERLATRARAALPAYMVPRRFVSVPELPLSPSGKTDKRALAEQLS
ncbi:amino acid adenylation domain-containing protein [Streptomyces pinistramenti]|uniref:amino acid adenylation domain-containing protein n=1 Tax=Streptomyces pinistramenti TaxID=2884812 RepID=UPI001D095C63|nr:amino acid adenylation domain-containing protein [Streptomyces pinistramenti]MCB5906967.1 amino acid adenylation domain-containing protein [Streptomyces pinistramenti]